MEEIEKIFKRADFHEIRSFLCTGGESEEKEWRKNDDYESWKKEDEKDLYELLESIFPIDGSERDDALLKADQAIVTNQDIYMEIGISIGIQLIVNILINRGSLK